MEYVVNIWNWMAEHPLGSVAYAVLLYLVIAATVAARQVRKDYPLNRR
jgi:hypothetical protein